MNTNNLPLDFQHPGGFVEEVMNYINATAVCNQPVFSLAAALSLAGVLYGRHFCGEDGQRTNLFVMTVGYTSSGKDHPLKTIARILDAGGATNLRLGQVTSDSAIEWALKRQPRQIALIDEAGHYFSGVSDPAAKGSPAHAIKPALLELWSSANARWKGKQRVPRDGKEVPPLEIDMPHLCLYATTQPQIMFESMTRNDLRDGWLSRNLFFISKTRPKPEAKPQGSVPSRILAEVLAWKNEPTRPVVTVPTAPEARAVFAAFNDTVHARMLDADLSGDETNYLYGKAYENAVRIALILAVSRAGEGGRAVVGKCDAEYATGLVEYLIGDVIGVIHANMADSADERAMNRILQIVAHSGSAGILKGELTRRTQFIRRTLRDDYLKDLVESHRIVERDANTCGVRYVLEEFAGMRE